ncbi:hypothetical protein E2C01_005424 [Portunus trituberculatus]|uniref:Uncharacterized protein n=1 Tax=Portunus trituberculatus TaxID=210409 RepID=A0A5B7CTI1_PORTR|nr:hypothetical protein [Portunus trituberculatus]
MITFINTGRLTSAHPGYAGDECGRGESCTDGEGTWEEETCESDGGRGLGGDNKDDEETE